MDTVQKWMGGIEAARFELDVGKLFVDRTGHGGRKRKDCCFNIPGQLRMVVVAIWFSRLAFTCWVNHSSTWTSIDFRITFKSSLFCQDWTSLDVVWIPSLEESKLDACLRINILVDYSAIGVPLHPDASLMKYHLLSAN